MLRSVKRYMKPSMGEEAVSTTDVISLSVSSHFFDDVFYFVNKIKKKRLSRMVRGPPVDRSFSLSVHHLSVVFSGTPTISLARRIIQI